MVFLYSVVLVNMNDITITFWCLVNQKVQKDDGCPKNKDNRYLIIRAGQRTPKSRELNFSFHSPLMPSGCCGVSNHQPRAIKI